MVWVVVIVQYRDVDVCIIGKYALHIATQDHHDHARFIHRLLLRELLS